MKQSPAIGSVMTRSPVSIDAGATVEAAQLLMAEKTIRHLPVTRSGELISIVTDRDIHLAVAANKNLAAAREMRVDDICALQLYQVDVETPMDEVLGHMAEKGYGSVLITRGGVLAGIFTANDACRYLALCLRGEMPTG